MARHHRTAALQVVLALLLGATWWVSATVSRTNGATLPNGITVSSSAQSASLFCVGFTGVGGLAPASVVFFNASSHTRTVRATLTSTRAPRGLRVFRLAPHTTYTISASSFHNTYYYAVSAIVNGGGVVAALRGSGDDVALVPCASEAATTWSLTGLSTRVDTTSVISLFNPSPTPAVINLNALSAAGAVSPQGFQGLVLAPLALVSVSVGAEVVNENDVLVDIDAVRGSVVAAASLGWTGRRVGATIVAGHGGPQTSFDFPSAPTNNDASAVLAFANDSYVPASITVAMSGVGIESDGVKAIQPFQLTLGARSVGRLTVSPTTRLPAAGAVTLRVTSSIPINAELITNSLVTIHPWYVAPTVAGPLQLLWSDAATGFGSISLVNTTSHSCAATVTYFARHTTVSATTLLSPNSVHHTSTPLGAAGSVYAPALVQSSCALGVAAVIAGPPNGVRVENGSGGGE